MVEFKNHSERLAKEFEALEVKNLILFHMIKELGEFTQKQFNKPLIITMIYRTPEEQDDIYKNDPKYIKRKFKSPHQFWHAVDLRSASFNKIEITYIEEKLNKNYNNINHYKWTAKKHNVGRGNHFHIQFVRK